MTTIIVDRRPKQSFMISDNQTTTSTGIIPCKKIYRIEEGPNEGHIAGTTGCIGPSILFLKWYANKAIRDWADVLSDSGLDIDTSEDEDFECVILRKEGIFLVDRFFVPYTIVAPYWAVGSGACFALGAMDQGASAYEALIIASQRDTYTSKMGRPFQELALT